MTTYDLSGSNYSQVDAANVNPGSAGMAVGQAPSNVGAAWRTQMGSIKRAYDWDHAGTWATVGGTGNAITLAYPVAPNAYVQGQKHAFKATAANSGATTININSLGVKNVFKKSPAGAATACTGNEIQSGDIVELEYDGTQFQIMGGAAGVAGPASSVSGNITTFNGTSGASIQDSGVSPTVLMPTGAVIPYAGSAAPTGWLLAFGQAVSRTTYATLFAAISTTFGVGDGSTTFNLPDLRGRFAAGADAMGGSAANRLGSGATGGITGSATVGASGGQQSHTQTLAELAAHSHIAYGNTIGASGSGVNTLAATPSGNDQATSSTGSGTAFNVTPPVLVLNYIIKT